MQRSVIFFYTQPSPYIAPFNMLNTVKTPRNLIFNAGLNVCILGTMLLPTWAQSAELGDFYNLGPRPKETAVRAGFITLNAARYQGSDEQKISVVPGIFLQASNGLFADPFNGVGYVFEPAGNLIYGIRANIETGRSVEKALPGFDKIKTRLNPGVFANYTVNEQLTLKSALRMGLGDAGDGGLLNLGATYKIYNANFVNVALNASVKYANSSYMQSYFGVSQSQSAASGMAAYQPAAGFAAAQAGLGLTVGFPISREIYVFSSASVQRVMGDAANSPIVKKKTQPAAFVGAVYSF
jgi:MipA family protein